MIFTASWRSELPTTGVTLVSISRSSPRGRAGFRTFRQLTPPKWFRDPMPEKVWVNRYEREVLKVLDANVVVAELTAMGGGGPVLLLCWEPAPPNPDWCHRALVSRWLQREVGLAIPEFGFTSCGCGATHPKLPRSLLP